VNENKAAIIPNEDGPKIRPTRMLCNMLITDEIPVALNKYPAFFKIGRMRALFLNRFRRIWRRGNIRKLIEKSEI
jgi:hypothetical protein